MKIKHHPFNRPGQALRVPGGSQISEQSTHDGAKVVSPTHRPPFPSGNFPGNHFCQSTSRSQSIISARRFSDNIWNRTRDLPTCSAVPQTTEPTRASSPPTMKIYFKNLKSLL